MGVKDTVTTKYMRQIEIFADIFNFYIYDGKQVIDPASLEELDTRELGGSLRRRERSAAAGTEK